MKESPPRSRRIDVSQLPKNISYERIEPTFGANIAVVLVLETILSPKSNLCSFCDLFWSHKRFETFKVLQRREKRLMNE